MEKVEARLILEMLGRPPKHIVDTFATLLERLAQEKGVNVLHKEVHTPVKVKDSADLYTTFAEIEASFESIRTLFGIIFAYMPSNVELIEPQNLKLTNNELNDLINLLAGRLHMYEAITKRLVGERDTLIGRLKAVSGENIKVNKPSKSATPKASKKKL